MRIRHWQIVIGCCALLMMPLGCGDDGGGGEADVTVDTGGEEDGGKTDAGDDDAAASVITTCTELCAFAPVDASTADCVVDIILATGNSGVLTEPLCAASNTSTASCLACYTATSVSDADCTAAHSGCF